MNTSHVFRSHLMQQFMAAARTQSRPPLALLGVTSEESSSTTTSERNTNQHNTHQRDVSSTRRTYTGRLSESESRALSSFASMMSSSSSSEHRMFTSASLSSDHLSATSTSLDFQNILKARKTTSRFALDTRDVTFWKEALDRAVACGLTAPNHKRTEPFRFRRLLAPSESTQRLAEIAFQVSLRHKKSIEEAERKRHKWQQIPAFLVTLVDQGGDSSMVIIPENKDLYEPLPYVAPASELALEDYAAACAAVQNVLLSLHAEGIASKWATGPVIQTPAFRHLVQARPHDRVVGIIMVGMPHTSIPVDQGPRRRRRRRRAMEEILQDL
ncbi:hypothetical protein FisN_22Lh062 [Fistulifera solaris]|uniref:Nitroreductase domain-containing protein n=1 Tax=Fistulifera solaris TaxID=1519565 RepID=A0A1Z5JBL0_FISSO|nr:hypothetical protein FisN_22Lh062 [Fistulifera solaris]|eukprot:GAX11390.1 hypothetical protein FisN_22Lh062 [Fistulifera solaris]